MSKHKHEGTNKGAKWFVAVLAAFSVVTALNLPSQSAEPVHTTSASVVLPTELLRSDTGWG